jgi:hypothetical protein
MKNIEHAQAAVVAIWANSEPDVNICRSASAAISSAIGGKFSSDVVSVTQVDMMTTSGYSFDAFRVVLKYTDGDTQKVSLICVFPASAGADTRREILITLIRAINNEWPVAEKKEAEGE